MKILDMHCDTISELLDIRRKGDAARIKENTLRSNGLHIDLEKMKKADYLLQNFALFVHLSSCENPLEEVLELADVYYDELDKNKDLIRPVYSYADIESNRKAGLMSAMLTVEEGGVCKGNPAFLRTLYRLGVRMLTLTWNFPNELGWPNLEVPGEGVDPESFRPDFRKANVNQGLTETGIAFVQEMEHLGMIVDVSHLSDAGFMDVLRVTKKPFVASHSNARAVCSWARNLTDDMIRLLAERGGVTGLNFCPAFLTDVPDGEATYGSIAAIVEHAKHIVNVGGTDCLGLGTDFDGIKTHDELPDASCMPVLIDAFGKAGFTSSQVDKILLGNVLRVYKEVLV